MSTPRLAIAIASHQRRDALLRLLGSLADELRASPAGGDVAAHGIVVVLDGSTDGSAEAVRGFAAPVPVRVVEQPHRGLAATRNAGWRAAREIGAELVLFLDDDLVAAPGLVGRHLAAHRHGGPSVAFGPCPIPDDWPVAPAIREFWRARYAELAGEPHLTRFDRFSGANTSVPIEVLDALGGYDESFTGYGLEDYEFATRLLAAGVAIAFVAEAVAWHYVARPPRALCRNRYEEGRNLVRFARLHGARVAPLLPVGAPPRPATLLRRVHCATPGALRAAATALANAALVLQRFDARRAERYLVAAAGTAYYAGLRAEDRDQRVLTADLTIRPELTCAP